MPLITIKMSAVQFVNRSMRNGWISGEMDETVLAMQIEN